MSKNTKLLLGILGLLIIVGVAEYTVGGGWKAIQRELRRKKMHADNAHLMKGDKKFFDLPAPQGPENAPIKIVVFLNPYNSCHQDFVMGWQTVVEPYKDKIRLVFKDITDKESHKLLEGYPVGCETVAILNGLMQIKVPWQEEPIMFEGSMGPGGGAEVFKRLVEWLLTDEGRKELERQRAEFEKERQRRLAKQRQAEEKTKSKKGSEGGREEKPASTGSAKTAQPTDKSIETKSDKTPKSEANEPAKDADADGSAKHGDQTKLTPDPDRKEPMMPFTPDSWAEGQAACTTSPAGK